VVGAFILVVEVAMLRSATTGPRFSPDRGGKFAGRRSTPLKVRIAWRLRVGSPVSAERSAMAGSRSEHD